MDIPRLQDVFLTVEELDWQFGNESMEAVADSGVEEILPKVTCGKRKHSVSAIEELDANRGIRIGAVPRPTDEAITRESVDVSLKRVACVGCLGEVWRQVRVLFGPVVEMPAPQTGVYDLVESSSL